MFFHPRFKAIVPLGKQPKSSRSANTQRLHLQAAHAGELPVRGGGRLDWLESWKRKDAGNSGLPIPKLLLFNQNMKQVWVFFVLQFFQSRSGLCLIPWSHITI